MRTLIKSPLRRWTRAWAGQLILRFISDPFYRAGIVQRGLVFLKTGNLASHLVSPLSQQTLRKLQDLKAGLSEDIVRYLEPLPPFESWQSVNGLDQRRLSELVNDLEQMKAHTPKISIVTPVYNTPEKQLRELIDSVLRQVYPDFELCLVDDSSSAPHIAPLLDELAVLDPRIRIRRMSTNGGISTATNAAVEMATGGVLTFVDHDDLITPDCLAELALYYARHSDADIVYSDDDKINSLGQRFSPNFKPIWSPILLLSYMYMGHIFSVKRDLYLQLCGFKSTFDGAQDYEFALRATEQARHVGHIPRILYHWRATPGSTALSGDAKPRSLPAGEEALRQTILRRGVEAQARHPTWARDSHMGIYALDFIDHGPEVTIIIPIHRQNFGLKNCLQSLIQTSYKNYDVLVVNIGIDTNEELEDLQYISSFPRHRVFCVESRSANLNFSNIMNKAARQTSSEYLLFLNSNARILNPKWLSQLIGYGRLSGVGSVGARTCFDGTGLPPSGPVHSLSDSLFRYSLGDVANSNSVDDKFAHLARECGAVSASCMLTPKSLFEELGGFDEVNSSDAYSDFDYCYRLAKAGWRSVQCPDDELIRFEDLNPSKRFAPEEVARARARYGDWRDPYHNPNLSWVSGRLQPAAVRPAPESRKMRRLAVFTHNLNPEGAPNTLLDLVTALHRRGHVDAVVFSPVEGPLRHAYEAAGIRVVLFSLPPLDLDRRRFLAGCDAIGERLRAVHADFVIANTLLMFFAITAAHRVGLGSIWCQHESEPWQTYFDYVSGQVRPFAYAAFSMAYRVTYVAEASRRAWSELCLRGNFELIRHALPPERMAEELSRWTPPEARASLGFSDDTIVVLVAGTVCARKGQLDIIGALAQVDAAVPNDLILCIAGALSEESYVADVKQAIEELPPRVRKKVLLTGTTEDMNLYYRAADILVCTSRIESAPRVIMEAMAYGLPILTTPVFGIQEQVVEGFNAEFFQPGDINELATRLSELIKDEGRRRAMGKASEQVLAASWTFEEMVSRYAKLCSEAVVCRI